jgi:hypothetical protein
MPAFIEFDLDAMTAEWVSLGERGSQALAAAVGESPIGS